MALRRLAWIIRVDLKIVGRLIRVGKHADDP
jgi:hypothetical protein